VIGTSEATTRFADCGLAGEVFRDECVSSVVVCVGGRWGLVAGVGESASGTGSCYGAFAERMEVRRKEAYGLGAALAGVTAAV
jgi:hypothetical protein